MRKIFLLFIGLFLFTHLLHAQSFREQFTQANLLTEDGYYGLAVPIWLDLIKVKPDNANLQYKIGRCYLDMGIDREQALPYLIKASEGVKRIYDPFSSDFEGSPVETYFYLGKAYHIGTDLDSAEHFYRKFLSDAGKKHYLRPEAERGLEMCAVARELMKNPVDVDIVNIGSPVNSPYAEYSPIVALDENTLYFTSRRLRTDGTNERSIEATTGLFYEDMYVSYRNIRGQWMNPELLPMNVKDKHSSVVSMSPDGQRLYIYKIFGGAGNIYESRFELGKGWTEPALVGSDVNSESNEYFATISADEQRLYFVSDRKGGLGGKDIWYAKKLPTGEWGKAINLGKPINTAGDEDGPYLHPDGKTMYFSSNGHRSMGGYDVFYSQLDDEGEWGEPVNLGYPINTTDDDHSYISTPSGRRAYYASKGSNSMGSTDIYVIEYKADEEQAPEVDLSVFAVIKGWIFPSPGESLPDDILISIKETTTGAYEGEARPVERTGSFVFIVPSGGTYSVEFETGGKVIYAEEIVIPQGTQYQELSREIFLTPSTSDVLKVVALRDETLGEVIRWKMDLIGTNESLPIGSRVLYLDGEGTVLDTAYVSKDGYFEFLHLKDENYVLQPLVAGVDNSKLNIRLLDSGNEVRPIDMIEVEHVFYERGKEPTIVEVVQSVYRVKIGDGDQDIEEGTVVKFLDNKGDVLYTEIVREDGSFLYHFLPGDRDFRLQLVSKSDVSEPVVIVETFKEEVVRLIELSTNDNRLFDSRLKTDSPETIPVKEVTSEYFVVIGSSGTPIPLNSTVKFYDPETDELLFTEVVQDNGAFTFHSLDNGTDFKMEFISAVDVKKDVWIEEVENGTSVRKIPLNTADNRLFSSEELPVAVKQDPSKKTDKMNRGETPRVFTITLDYNRSGITSSDEEVKKMVDAIRQEIARAGQAKIILEGSASDVPTSLEGGNEGLAKRRLEAGKKALFAALESAQIDMNKISTIEENSGVNGPKYVAGTGQQKSLFLDYQYFKLSLD